MKTFLKSQSYVYIVIVIDKLEVDNIEIPSGQIAARGCGAHQAAAAEEARPPNRPRAASTATPSAGRSGTGGRDCKCRIINE